ncbi:MAG: RNA polymerase subunit sigma-70 [Planctomycetes bacterium]|nr:RNA polymerase subunit sigma-70 [Planctomycetota bacterium]
MAEPNLTLLDDGTHRQLRSLASALLRRRGGSFRARATSLVHEAYLRLARPGRAGARDHGHFLSMASRAMRFVLVDRARRQTALRRSAGERAPLPVEELALREAANGDLIVAIHGALERLSQIDGRLARVVELRFFGGLELHEVATATGVSLATAKRDWVLARAWLRREVAQQEEGR